MTQLLVGDSPVCMSLLDAIGLVVVAMLVVFLCHRHEERIYRRSQANPCSGKSFDASPACKRVARVRRDYLAVVCTRARDRDRRRQLHAQVRRTLRRRAYFQRSDGPVPAAAEVEKNLI